MKTFAKSIKESSIDLLKPESRTLLEVFARRWTINRASREICYLEVLYEQYQTIYQSIPNAALREAFTFLVGGNGRPAELLSKTEVWEDGAVCVLWCKLNSSPLSLPLLLSLSSHSTFSQKETLGPLFINMYSFFMHQQILKYRVSFQKNEPKGALSTSIHILNIIHHHPIYREAAAVSSNDDSRPDNLGVEMESLLREMATNRYNMLEELTAPFDDNDVYNVLEGLVKLADHIHEDLEADLKYFHKSFYR